MPTSNHCSFSSECGWRTGELASSIDPQHCAIMRDPLPVEHVWAHWFIMNGHSSSHFSHLDSWQLVKFFKVKSVLFLLCDWLIDDLRFQRIYFEPCPPLVSLREQREKGGTGARVFIRSHSQQFSCVLLCPPWHFIKNGSAVGGFPAAPRVWMKSSGNTDVVRDSLISCHL